MNRISFDNPLINPIFFIFIGVVAFFIKQQTTGKLNYFGIQFLILNILLFFVYIKYAILFEKKIKFNINSINPLFSIIIISIKIYTTYLLITSGGSDTFDDRLSVYGNSFLLGLDLSTSIFLFPLIPLFSSSILIRKLSLYIYFISFFTTTFLAPSKSTIIVFVFSLLLFRFLKRKNLSSITKITKINFFSIKSLTILIFIFIGTLYFLYLKLGEDFLMILSDRISMNFDIAIYASEINQSIYPDHSNLFYAILPILSKIDPSLYDLDYYNIPQWVLSESLGISRYGRYGYPNDNLAAGLLISFKEYGIGLYLITLVMCIFLVKKILARNNISTFELYILLSIPLFFASTQDFMIRLYVVTIIYYSTEFFTFFLKKCTRNL